MGAEPAAARRFGKDLCLDCPASGEGLAATIEVSMPFQEVVEAEGHLIDSHIMENIFDKVVEYSGRFEVEQFRIGRTNSEASYLRLKVEAPDEQAMERLLQELFGLGCAPRKRKRSG